MKPHTNPLLLAKSDVVGLDTIAVPTIHRRALNAAHRQIRDLRKGQTAAAAIAGLDHETEIFGFTKGQFGLLDLLGAVLPITGPCHLSISTWTAAPYEVQSLAAMLQRGDITGTRWLVDFSMARREPATTAQIRDAFGPDNIRVAQNHAKWALFQNGAWRVVLRSSMNLNMNPRLEDFQIAHDPALAAFFNTFLDHVFAKQQRELADAAAYEIVKACQADGI
jgi:hypothetical protein